MEKVTKLYNSLKEYAQGWKYRKKEFKSMKHVKYVTLFKSIPQVCKIMQSYSK